MAFSETTSYIPLKQAAKKYGIPEKALLEQVESGSIIPARLPNGEMLVAESDVDPKAKTKEQLIDERYSELIKQPITISEAEKKYNVLGRTIRFWVSLGYINTINDSYPMRLDEAEVAYCTEIFHERQKSGIGSGAPLLDENGLRYELKRPELSEYRRRKGRTSKKEMS
jgi:hypothetical protein